MENQWKRKNIILDFRAYFDRQYNTSQYGDVPYHLKSVSYSCYIVSKCLIYWLRYDTRFFSICSSFATSLISQTSERCTMASITQIYMAMYQLSGFGLKLTKINSNHADVRRHTFLEKSCCTVSLYLLMFENVPVSVNIFLNGSHNIVYK